MPLLADFLADIDASRIDLPDDVLEALRREGVGRVRVTIARPSPEPAMLAVRGIDPATIERVAEVQKLEVAIAAHVLAGEGSATGGLAERLGRIASAEGS